MESTTHCLSFDRCCIDLLDTVFHSCFNWRNNFYSIRSTILYRGRRIVFILCGCIFNHLHLFIATHSDDYLRPLDRNKRSTSTTTYSTNGRQRLCAKKRSTSLTHATFPSINHCRLHHSTWSFSGMHYFKLMISRSVHMFVCPVDVYSSDNQLGEGYCLANLGCFFCQLGSGNIPRSILYCLLYLHAYGEHIQRRIETNCWSILWSILLPATDTGDHCANQYYSNVKRPKIT